MNREVAMLQEISKNRLEKWAECSRKLKHVTFALIFFLTIAFLELIVILKLLNV